MSPRTPRSTIAASSLAATIVASACLVVMLLFSDFKAKEMLRQLENRVTSTFTGLLRGEVSQTPYPYGQGVAAPFRAVAAGEGCTAMSLFRVSNNAQFNAALKVATSGDVIALAPGVYDPIVIFNKKVADGFVAITSQDPNDPAVMSKLSVSQSAGLIFDTLKWSVAASNGSYGYSVAGSDRVMINNVDVEGVTAEGARYNNSGGLIVRESSNVSVTNSEFSKVQFGLMHLNNNSLTIAGNYFHELRHDAIRGGGVNKLTIEGNYITNIYPDMVAGDHPDGIQLWTSNTELPSTDVVIRGNVMTRGEGGAFQMIFLGDEKKIGYVNVTVEDNLLIGAFWHGITVAERATGVTVTGNQVYSTPEQHVFITTGPDAVVNNNIAPEFRVPGVPRIVNKDAVVTDGGASLVKAWAAEVGSQIVGLSPTFATQFGVDGHDVATQPGAGDVDCEQPLPAGGGEAAPASHETGTISPAPTAEVAAVDLLGPATVAPANHALAGGFSGIDNVFGGLGGRSLGDVVIGFDPWDLGRSAWATLGVHHTYDLLM